MKKHLKRLLSIALVLVMVFALAACGSQETTPTGSPSPPQETPQISQSPEAEQPAAGKKVGVVMPTKSLQRWNEDGANVKAALEAKGYTVDLQYADNKQDVQNSQLENMITMGCDVLVIASIDGGALGGVLQQAKAANIPVIAYDRLITNTDKCDYYATFDNYGVGKCRENSLSRLLALTKAKKAHSQWNASAVTRVTIMLTYSTKVPWTFCRNT